MAMHQLSILNNRSRAGRHDGSMSVVKRLTGATCTLAGAVVSGVVGLVHARVVYVLSQGRLSPALAPSKGLAFAGSNFINKKQQSLAAIVEHVYVPRWMGSFGGV